MRPNQKRNGLYSAAFAAWLALAGCASQTGLAPQSTAPSKSVAAAAAHQRLLPLEGGQNFRDLGGYAGAGGKQVKWGLLLRSGAMNGLTAADYNYLEDTVGLRTVIDLRSTQERKYAAVNWPAAHAPTVLAEDYAMDASAITRVMSKGKVTPDEVRAAMAGAYRETPFQFASQYRRMFENLLAGKTPLAFNCSAGKDRTGVAAALLLTALGVPRETVIDDYLLSNEYFKPAKLAMSPIAQPAGAANGSGNIAASLGGLSPEITKVLMGVDRSYIEASFAAIEQRPGGLDGYFSGQLGLSKQRLRVLRARYLQ